MGWMRLVRVLIVDGHGTTYTHTHTQTSFRMYNTSSTSRTLCRVHCVHTVAGGREEEGRGERERERECTVYNRVTNSATCKT